ncbi:hypothetical protein L198_04760 [Cryptococcus wingfieldii CBS 7118]|uniref:Uncharacterized protein n=1 Tax=Cryptococcus wingfieldii CBS 7118 TaxID=1295528 RepID=A0A1E3J3D5_9TREE|nr:hypothetical protein L198_04760 [Cryptococcus wingfieldii CBS 7118]ODN95364.1 hypothetical protein L198_04760 [Cryptococcus wingfieldii CBS 7118]
MPSSAVHSVDHAFHTPNRPSAQNPNSTPTPRLSPILNYKNPVVSPIDPAQPEFAELLTPLKFRRRKLRPRADQQPTSIPPVAGPSRLGYYTLEGDLYRGAARDPTQPEAPPVEDDAVSLGTASIASSSSTWSWGSGNFDRALAVIERVGEALGVRRGSTSSSSSSSSNSESEDDNRSQVTRRRRRRRGSTRLSRTVSNLSRTTSHSPERPKREQVPKKRQFTLLLPPNPKDADITSAASSVKDAITLAGSDKSPKLSGELKYPPDRVVTTPSLPSVLDHIRNVRLSNGLAPLEGTPPATPGLGPKVPVRRGGSAPGHTRAPKRAPAFVNPPLPARTQSRLHALRGADTPPVRPKSVSDLLGMSRPGSPTGGLASPAPTAAGTPMVERDLSGLKAKAKQNGCWWLDVSCPTWEDLRDIGELLGLHPLTLEDVLHQDPREKLDTFDKLGYYLIAIRALDESYFKYTPGSSVPQPTTTKVSEKPMSPEEKTFNEKATAEERLATPDMEDLELKKEGRRRGWGMGRAQGKMVSKTGEKVEIIEDRPGKEGLEGVGVGAVNVYLVVLADGIVSFHYDDISKHTRRVLDRVLTLHNPTHGADWIAHGLIDSIIDAFFPLIRYVDGAVDDIDSLTIDPTTDPRKTAEILESVQAAVNGDPSVSGRPDSAQGRKHSFGAKSTTLVKKPFFHQLLSPPKIHLPKALIYVRLFILPITSAVQRHHERNPPKTVFGRSTMLKNITDVRKLVTGLTRLLGAKGVVIGRLRKRARNEDNNVEAYIGDVEDHILLLQTSLLHYEYILSHCQPAYLSHLRISLAFTRGRISQSILALSTVAISVLPMQFITSLFSINVNTPHNGDNESDTLKEPDGSMSPFNYFGCIVVAIFLVACAMVTIIRYWRWLARKKNGRERGVAVPEFWDGYWGWA